MCMQVDYAIEGRDRRVKTVAVAGVVRYLAMLPHPGQHANPALPDLRVALVDLFEMRTPAGRALRASPSVKHALYPVELASITRKLVTACVRDTAGRVRERWFMPYEVVGFDQVAMRRELDEAMSEAESD
jgi:hypothetical protein